MDAILGSGKGGERHGAGRGVRLRAGRLEVRLDGRGRVAGIRDLRLGAEYGRGRAPFWSAVIGGQRVAASGVRPAGRDVAVDFGGRAAAVFRVIPRRGYVVFSVLKVSPDVQELVIAELRFHSMKTVAATLNAASNGVFSLAVLALTPAVRCAPAGSRLQAACCARYGMAGSRIALFGCAARRLASLIRLVERAEGLPHITLGGRWGKQSEPVRRSYLFLHDLGEANCDRAIAAAKRMRAGMIMILETWAGRTMGHFPIDRRLFPHGLAGLKAVVARIHAAGLKAGLHYLSTGVSANDRTVTPVPDCRLVEDAATVLTAALDARQTDIPCADASRGFPAALHPRGLYYGNGTDIRIDDELITYETCTTAAPGGFRRCRRGAYGTRAAPHAKGTPVVHLQRSFGYFLVDLDTSLAGEVAGRIARVVDGCGFDMLYFDGAEWLQGDHWYYNPRLLLGVYRRLAPRRRNHLHFQASSHTHFSWHLVSRQACADGYRNVRDNVSHASRKYPSFFNNLMPVDIGWYGLGQADIAYEDVECVLAKSLAWESSVGFSTSLAVLDQNPESGALLDLAGRYERLRLARAVPAPVRRRLRRPDNRHLVRPAGGGWRFCRVMTRCVRALGGAGARWALACATPGRIREIQIRLGPVVRPEGGGHEPRGVRLLSGAVGEAACGAARGGHPLPIPFGCDRNADRGTRPRCRRLAAGGPSGGPCGRFTAGSRRADRSAWTVFRGALRPGLDLGAMRGLAGWFWGDGQGAQLAVRLRDRSMAWRDFIVPLDFRGWRYRELPNLEGIVKPDYCGPLDLADVNGLFFLLTDLPPRATTEFRVAGLCAVSRLSRGVCRRPELIVGSRSIRFPAALEPGDTLTAVPGRRAVVADAAGRCRRVQPDGGWPVLRRGANPIRFRAEGPLVNEVRVQIAYG